MESESLALPVFSLCVAALFVKFWAITWVQAAARFRHRAFATPEDNLHFGKGAPADRPDAELAVRGQRALRNDLENLPWFFMFGWLYLVSGAWPTGMLIYGPIFVLARCVHSVAYLRALQPLRNRAYVLGVLVILVLLGHVVTASVAAL